MTVDIEIGIDERSLDYIPEYDQTISTNHKEKMSLFLNGQISEYDLSVSDFESDTPEVFLSPFHIMCMGVFVKDLLTGLYSFSTFSQIS